MLTRFHKVLIGLLVVQIALSIVMLTRDDDAAPAKEQPILVGFDAAKVTRVQVFAAKADKPVDLVKRGDKWVVVSSFDYPADASKVDEMLAPIAKMTAAGPIATQKSRHKQLRVDDAEFERKLVITMGGKDVTLTLGGSAGGRRTAVRIGAEDRVYGVAGVPAIAAGSEARQWVDPSYVKIPRDEIAKVTVAGTSTAELVRTTPSPAGSGSAQAPEASTWTVQLGGAPVTLAAGESLDTATIDRIVDQVAMIELAAPADPKRDATRPTATLTIERKAAAAAPPVPTVLDVIADGASYWVRQRDHAHAVLVDKARLEEALTLTRDKLVKKPAPPAEPSSKATTGATPK